MTPFQIKNDILAVIQTEKYFAEMEFFRQIDNESIPHKERISIMREQLNLLTDIHNAGKILNVLIPEKEQQSPATPPQTPVQQTTPEQ